MHPYITQYVAMERAKDLRERAAAARRARRGHGPVLASRGHVRRHGSPRWA